MKFINVRYETNEITIEPRWPLMDHESLLQIAVLGQDAMVHTSKRYSTDTSLIILPMESCKPLELSVVHLVDSFTGMLLGSTKIEPGEFVLFYLEGPGSDREIILKPVLCDEWLLGSPSVYYQS